MKKKLPWLLIAAAFGAPVSWGMDSKKEDPLGIFKEVKDCLIQITLPDKRWGVLERLAE